MTTDSGNSTVTTGFYTGSTLNTTAGTGGWNGTTYTAGIELSTGLSQCPEKTPTRAFFLMKVPTTLKICEVPLTPLAGTWNGTAGTGGWNGTSTYYYTTFPWNYTTTWEPGHQTHLDMRYYL